MKVLFFVALLGILTSARGDTPADCTFEEIEGIWVITESARTGNHTIACEKLDTVVYTKKFTLEFPNTATDELGNKGTWTMIYNQGFEINIDQRSYFAVFYYEENLSGVVSYCDKTHIGWSRDKTVRNWSCFRATKNTPVQPRARRKIPSPLPKKRFTNDHKFIEKINYVQSLWKARAYPEHEKYTLENMFRRAGGANGIRRPSVTPFPITEKQKAMMIGFPQNFDWRDIEGVNYVSPVRDQEDCGSCYAFASLASLEARIRIATRNERQDIFSVQDVLDCSYLSEGCNGGYSYLTGGRYAQDQGLVNESCNPYLAHDLPQCETDPSCPRTYVSEYTYIGGFFGGCNEALMMETLINEGPIPAAFMVYEDFYNYGGGIYIHTQLTSDFNPLEVTNHEVLVVGYGVDEATGEKFWTVKNSWGENWGEKGFFKVLKGVDECGIESEALSPIPIP